MSPYLSKSKYLAGKQCPKRLWLDVHEPDRKSPLTPSLKYRFQVGNRVGVLARERFPGGTLIDNGADPAERARRTQEAISAGASAIFEAAFLHNGIFVVSDILTRNEDGSWNVIEVKSSTRVKREHIADLAIQVYALKHAGLSIRKKLVMTVNRDCVLPDMSDYFTVQDVGKKVRRALHGMTESIESMRATMSESASPGIQIGEQCGRPRPCPYKEYCWKSLGKHSTFDIPGLSLRKKRELRGRGVVHIRDIPPDYHLTHAQEAYVRRMLEEKTYIRRKQMREMLAELEYPIHFFDFETDNPALPRFDGFRPFMNYPFQYSCHILHEDGLLSHHDYLHTGRSDPRRPLVESLLGHVGDHGSIVAYYATFERSVIEVLAADFPQHAARLNSIAGRLWDQLEVIKKCYKHYGFGNSNSLKAVLPVLVPELSYNGLGVQNGGDAQSVWNQMIEMEDGGEKDRLIHDLEEYCKLDTLAMVEIHRKLVEI